MKTGKIDYNSRDYNFSDIEPDERFTQTTKEMLITFAVYGVYIVLMMANLYLVGGYDVSKYTYVFGFPLWIFLQICILIGMVISVELVTHFVYRDMDITPRGKILPRKSKKNASVSPSQR